MQGDPLYLAFAVVVGVLAVARLTRLLVDDSWPPMLWAKGLYLSRANAAWADLVNCPWCAAPWFAAPMLAWAWLSNLHWTWWAFSGWLAASMAASMVVVRDEPPA